MKNKPDQALLRSSNISNELKKRAPKFRETIPSTDGHGFSVRYENGHTGKWTLLQEKLECITEDDN
jgi:hypothetical protein